MRANDVDANIRLNRDSWERYEWPKHGDEWDEQAAFCGQPYEAWKRALVREFIEPYLHPRAAALEIAPGHGRWTEALADRVERLYLVDVSPSCIDFCRRRFQARTNIRYFVNDGKSLAGVPDASVDFAWSYDSFVHMAEGVIENYLRELRRVLRAGGGTAVIHHASKTHGLLLLKQRLLDPLGWPGRALGRVLLRRQSRGWRSDVSARMVRQLARRSGLTVTAQTDCWGGNLEFNCRLCRDQITVLRKNDDGRP